MGCEIAINRAWDELDHLSDQVEYSIPFLTDNYSVRLKNRSVVGRSEAAAVPDHIVLLLLHYLIGIMKRQFCPSGQWVSFRSIWGGSSYYPAYRRAVLLPLIERFGADPKALARALLSGLGGRAASGGDLSVDLATFPGVVVRVTLWSGEGAISPEAILLFDSHLPHLLATEDIVVLHETVVGRALSLASDGPII
ncbi:MAG TPA: DUF3786 domain-containing protein [Methanotrichaceae archaeon]|nr:DUF3786 domain-containing protein [Methanotrichaceae archaeon]HQF15803.1 DUF3786 domain-containing protein [Methanotrichaceae archaeon]HQI90521.1 DUF3786 domain-containing protein [Methanotrichaceae archaeon]HQJ28090.1 DUF3786 domain-containing protein [Methanotrichaceae archaeon]